MNWKTALALACAASALAADAVLLLDRQATKSMIRSAVTNIAAQAMPGDTFVFQHSSHGGQREGTDTFLCVYDECFYYDDTAYNDYEIAEDLAAFPSGVKVAMIVDACHSGGLFKRAGAARAAARPFDLAGRVLSIMAAGRAARRARGEGEEGGLSPDEVGWATAAEYYESSMDGGFYHTDEWLSNPAYGDEYYDYGDEAYHYPDTYRLGGVFLASGTWGWWSGSADADGDGSCDVYEFWSQGYGFCSRLGEFWWGDPSYNFYPQCTNVSVLASIELGRCGAPAALPGVGEVASAEMAATALAGAADSGLVQHVSDAGTYGEFREWALGVLGADGKTPAGAEAVLASPFAWASFAVDSPVLIEELGPDDIEISSVALAGSGDVAVEVGLKDVHFGDAASVARLVELFGLEGSPSPDGGGDGFSPRNVALKPAECGRAEGDKVRLVATPAEDSGVFFLRVRLR